MQIIEIGYQSLLRQSETVFHPDGLSGILLLLTGGAMQLTIGDAGLQAEAGDTLLISPETALRMTAEQDLLYDWVLFVPGGDDNFYQALQIPENTLLRFGDTAFLSVLMQQLCAEFYASNAKRSEKY